MQQNIAPSLPNPKPASNVVPFMQDNEQSLWAKRLIRQRCQIDEIPDPVNRVVKLALWKQEAERYWLKYSLCQ